MDMFYNVNGWVILIGLLVLIVAASEIGFRLGRKNGWKTDEKMKAQISVVQGALIGVLGLLLGFTMSMAVGRFEARRELVVDEANAIGTSWLRTHLLPEPESSEIANLLREYVDVRVQFGDAGENIKRLQELRREGQRLQGKFWSIAAAYAQTDPRPVKTSLLLQSLNQTIDLEARRWAALQNHVPSAVIYVNMMLAVMTSLLVAYSFGTNGLRHHMSMWSLAFAIIVVLGVIIDLDRPRRGFIRVSPQPLIDLQRQLQNPDSPEQAAARILVKRTDGHP
jgi:hypothetical protein